MKTSLLLVSLLLLPACSDRPAQGAERKDADNTARNERDKDGKTLTPTDQGESEADLAISRAIRKALVDDDSLSVNAENVKVITRDGVVTLRGPVASAVEKARVVEIAEHATGVTSVVDELEVKTN
jgi:hyperosmotically inducible periplasmic protein